MDHDVIASTEVNIPFNPKNEEFDCKLLQDSLTASLQMVKNYNELVKKLKDAEITIKNIRQRLSETHDASLVDKNELAEIAQTLELAKITRSDKVHTESKLKRTDHIENIDSVSKEVLSRSASIGEGAASEALCGESYPLVPLSKESKIFIIKMSVCNFSPKEVEIKVDKNYLVVHGKHNKLIDAHGIVSREFTRKFAIPEFVDVETFRALFDCYSVLHIEASLKPAVEKPREIPVLLEEGTARQHTFDTFDDLGPAFEELAERHIQDGYQMAAFARNLARQLPSDYIPLEEVVSRNNF